ncbi:uncharacterized protein LACBIDRAFT_298227 [Laccaria bicolor S238N-H82]|uniref:Predicted protein n=1 Tax=Laccaria bicolor (strain S238N-H82 / ATCC MYA-4686) TaxID=486041 RepID=B0DCI3_LACBS|nr:uncharacterized protein LACBIDRAFT_298227 [Laccaria bicolor S238N-H82]EDR07735.1 predicted protein [Laccaria bicolor S238N-H82]|eukprot:XP_001881524.1 predicted protein [Laccaria bicolor S238N-H82]
MVFLLQMRPSVSGIRGGSMSMERTRPEYQCKWRYYLMSTRMFFITIKMWCGLEMRSYSTTSLNPPSSRGLSRLVFESPVRSGFLMPRGANRNRNRSAFSPEVKRPDWTAKRPQTAVFCGL